MTAAPPSGQYRLVDGRHGRFLVNPRDVYIGRSLLEYGEFSELEHRVVAQLVPPGGIVIEAGANIGALTVPMARHLGRGGLVYAFEPQILVFQQLCANLALNDLLNVQASNAACGDRPGWLPVRRLDPATTTNFGGVTLDRLAGPTATRVRIERLDEAVDPPRLDMIKADVEGMERAVLEGASGLIERFRPAIYVEAHHAEHAPALIRLLRGMRYRLWWHLPPFFSPANHAGNPRDVFGGIVSLNMLGLPEERRTTVAHARPVAGEDDHPRNWPRTEGASGTRAD